MMKIITRPKNFTIDLNNMTYKENKLKNNFISTIHILRQCLARMKVYLLY